MASGPRRFNAVSVFIWLLIGASFYLSYKVVPVIWRKTQLETMVKDASYALKQNSEDDRVRSALIERAKTELGVELIPEEMEIEHLKDRVRLKLVWHASVRLLTGHSIRHDFVIKQETIFLR